MSEQGLITLIILFFGPTMLGGLLLDRYREDKRRTREAAAEVTRKRREAEVEVEAKRKAVELAQETTRKAEEVVRQQFAARMTELGLDRLDELEAFQKTAESKLALQEQLLITATNDASQLKVQLDRLSAALEQADASMRENAAMIEALQNRQQADQKELNTLRASNVDQERRLHDIEAERDALRTASTEKDARISDLQRQVDELTTELAETRKQLSVVANRTPTDRLPPLAGATEDNPLKVELVNRDDDAETEND